MPQIRPISDLRNKFTDISKIAHETAEPIFFTKNGYGDMVVMSMEAYEKFQFENELYFKLKEAAQEAKTTQQRYTHDEVFSTLRDVLAAKGGADAI